MKKFVLATVAATSLIVTSACNNGSSELIAESKAGDISKEDFYEAMKDRFGQDILLELVHGVVLDEKYDVSDKEIEEGIEELRAQYGGQLDLLIQQQGEEIVHDMVKVDLLRKKAAEDAVKVTEKDIKEYYDSLKGKIRASHILVKDEETAKEVKKKLDDGAKFEDLTAEYSTDGTAQNGGDLGWFGKEDMVEPFSKAAFALKEGEVSEPVKSDFGYHIINVTQTVKSFDEMKDELKEDVKQQKLNDPTVMQEAVNKAIKEADVKINDKDLEGIIQTDDKDEKESDSK